MKPNHTTEVQTAREYLRMKKVYRYRLKRIADMTDDEVIRTCHWWYTEHGLEREYREWEEKWLAGKGWRKYERTKKTNWSGGGRCVSFAGAADGHGVYCWNGALEPDGGTRAMQETEGVYQSYKVLSGKGSHSVRGMELYLMTAKS